MNLTRQHDTLPSATLDAQIRVIGAGGIGSWSTLSLAKLGFKRIEVVDFDTVDEVNIPSQVFSMSQVGKPKVTALYDVVKLLTDTAIVEKQERYAELLPCDILIVAVDNMAVRKQIAEDLLGGRLTARWIVDARMAIETGIIKPYNHETVKRYLNDLYTDEQAASEPCTNKAIAYTTLVIAGLVSKTVCMLLRHNAVLQTSFCLEYGPTQSPQFMTHTKAPTVFVAPIEDTVGDEDEEQSDEF